MSGKVVLGTMRLHEAGKSVDEWVEFFIAARRLGISTLHSSSEYESFPLLCRVLERVACLAPGVKFRHIVKLGEPHFDEMSFSAERLIRKVEQYKDRFGVVCIADVQWMWRHGIDNDPSRVEQFLCAAADISAAAESLKRNGSIERFLCFPYTPAFAAAALELEIVDGFVVYRNAKEVEYDGLLDRAGVLGKPCLVIRPFFGGQLLENGGVDPVFLLRFALDKPSIEAAVVSCSKLDHLEELIGGSA